MAKMPASTIISITFGLIAICNAGPLGLLSNVTSPQIGLTAGTCAVGDVVYMAGDEFPGSEACDRCQCVSGEVRCAKQSCEPRPGCKALHRPDQCCPTYQCECEQEGRIYGNGEKLVDPADPCRVCYCQGGEVVCRRIACFVRDDCRPRLVPGRCCPEYDNCPLRGVATIPGVAPPISSISTIEDVGTSAAPSVPKENIRQEITIKEITPVSEIPVITDVKVKEILPSPSIEVAEYSSSKSPLITREATSEKSVSNDAEITYKTETPAVSSFATSPSPELLTKSNEPTFKITEESLPSKISLPTQDSINSEIYPSNIPSVVTSRPIFETSDVPLVVVTTKAPAIIEEEDTSLIDHNPAFPPLPDDLSVQSNHDDEIVLEQEVSVPTVTFVTTKSTIKEPLTTMSEYISSSKPSHITTKTIENMNYANTIIKSESSTSTEKLPIKESPMLNLRSAIPTEILNIPSLVVEEINGELENATEFFTTTDKQEIYNTTADEVPMKSEAKIDYGSELHRLDKNTESDIITSKTSETTERSRSSTIQDKTTNSIAKSNFATEVTSQTEISSLPVETSNIKPSESIDTDTKETFSSSTFVDSAVTDVNPVQVSVLNLEPVLSTTKRNLEQTDHVVIDETTEFVQFNSLEISTDAEPVELIKLSPNDDKKAAVIQTNGEKNSVLTDLIKLVDDVASISDHTDSPEVVQRTTTSSSISDSEELIPVNAGYKSKNNNWNLNSITEIPVKSKNSGQTKQKGIEIEDDGDAVITDSSPPNDKVEPTTRRPIIDNVSDNMPENKIEKKDIEIITQSYVPTINKRPTKVVLKKEEVISAERRSSSAAPAVIETRVASTTELAVKHTEGIVEKTSTTSPAEN